MPVSAGAVVAVAENYDDDNDNEVCFMSTVHGPVLDRNVYQPGYFVGCGWSQWFTLDFPCLNAAFDDAVLFAEPLLSNANVNKNMDATTTTTFMPPLDVTSTTFHFQPPSV